jgi:putative FmdB family regulatory protein
MILDPLTGNKSTVPGIPLDMAPARWQNVAELLSRSRSYRPNMPIYEYRPDAKGCAFCRSGFDALQRMADDPLIACPSCGTAVRRTVSRFSACVAETTREAASTESKLREYEQQGQWSHAAELADKTGLQDRALDNYKKAGYNF